MHFAISPACPRRHLQLEVGLGEHLNIPELPLRFRLCFLRTCVYYSKVPAGFPSRGEDVAVYVFHIKPTGLAHSFLYCSSGYICLYGPFNCISFQKFFRKLSAFSHCSSGFISALLVLSAIYLFAKVSFNPDVILYG